MTHSTKTTWVLVVLVVFFAVKVSPQQPRSYPSIPDKFRLDKEFAARIRPALIRETHEPSGPYRTGQQVFHQLVTQAGTDFRWDLRIAANESFNAYSSPDGTIFIDQPLADLLGSEPGLWAAALAHEIAHVTHRDWALRYLFEHSLRLDHGAAASPSGETTAGWIDGNHASEQFAGFCRDLEVRADIDAMMLMARAGYHPDFMAALQHAIQARGSTLKSQSPRALHPEWGDREQSLRKYYAGAAREFDRLWPDWHASPGGNPPVVVFAREPVTRVAASHDWEVVWPIRCQNLSGSLEVILRWGSDHDGDKLRQATGCTSEKTLIRFTVPVESVGRTSAQQADLVVENDEGQILSRAILHKGFRF